MARLLVITLALWQLVCLPSHNDAARILGFFPATYQSDSIIYCAVAEALAQAGHNVTVLGTMPNLNQRARYNYIHIEAAALDSTLITQVINERQSMHSIFTRLTEHILQLSNETLTHPMMQQFLARNDAGAFDLLLLGYFLNDFHVGLAAHFQCPVVLCFAAETPFFINSMIGNPSELAYVPTAFSEWQQPMHFWQRVQNLLYGLLEEYVLQNVLRQKQQEYYDYHFPAHHYPTFEAMIKNISLVFVNHHFTQQPIRPNVPNLIEIGGIHVKDQPDPLPADLARILNESSDGVIYFSLGSIAQGSNLTPAKAKILFNVLSKLPQKVIWKWGATQTPGQSPNILYKSWLPQDDILAHPNLKLFITHGGQGSVVQAQYHGVPMVGIPLFGDQPSNMAKVERAGFGLTVDYMSMTEDSFSKALQEVLQCPKYSAAVRAFSQLYRDRPMTPRQTVNYWVNYVLRYGGARHLQSPAVHMRRWQLLSLDVLACLLATVGAVLRLSVALCRLLCCGEKQVVDKQAIKAKKFK